MTRKDFIIIADIIVAQYIRLRVLTDTPNLNDLLDPALAQLRHQIPRFDSTKFENYVRKELKNYL